MLLILPVLQVQEKVWQIPCSEHGCENHMTENLTSIILMGLHHQCETKTTHQFLPLCRSLRSLLLPIQDILKRKRLQEMPHKMTPSGKVNRCSSPLPSLHSPFKSCKISAEDITVLMIKQFLPNQNFKLEIFSRNIRYCYRFKKGFPCIISSIKNNE